jgi:phage regulator Rha-like protein
LEKEHYDVLKKIREVLRAGEFSCSSYITEQGKEMTEYLLNKDSFILLVMNYTGYNDFKRITNICDPLAQNI